MNIDVQFHGIELKADYKKSRITADSTGFTTILNSLVQKQFHEFGKRGTGNASSYSINYTHKGLIDLEFKTKPEEILELDRIVFHGEYFKPNDSNPLLILAQCGRFKFYPQRIDLKFDVSADFLPYSTINHHFVNDLITATASYQSWTSPEGARTWYAGVKRPQGYRISFYEAAKIHTGLPEGAHRVEVQLYGLEAQKFTDMYFADPTNEFVSRYMLYMLDKRISFREPSSDSNRARWQVCQWWQDITEGAGNFSEHTTVARRALDSNRITRLHQSINSRYDKLGLELFTKGLGRFLMDKRGVLQELFNQHPELNPAFGF